MREDETPQEKSELARVETQPPGDVDLVKDESAFGARATGERAGAGPEILGVASLPEIVLEKPDENRKYSTFNGVFRPTLLTILGVLMYLREGWVVGNAGLLGGVLVVLCCSLITGLTAFSISSITTNIRVGSGGVFSIISQSLGLEVGGGVGVPLFLAQGLSAAFYLQGIIDTWIYLFPDHPVVPVKIGFFLLAFLISFFSTAFAFRVQTLVMVGMLLALASIFLGPLKHPVNPSPVFIGEFVDGDFWILFAVFFPAVTGIMVGSSMSGNLKSPRRSIPLGTIAAWGTATLVYLSLAIWYGMMGTPEELRNTERIFSVEHAYWGPAVLIGLFSSCLSATLSTLVAAPRVLHALSQQHITPFSSFFSRTVRGEPRNASLFTGVMVLVTLLLGNLNAIAKILTMFFLVIYFMINLVLVIEQQLKMISFRPRFPISKWIPILGSICSFLAILIINPLFGLLAIVVVVGLYIYLDQKHLETPWETVHSGIFASIAYWAGKKVVTTKLDKVRRSWKPDLLIPVHRSSQLEGYFRIVHALAYPQGTVQVLRFLTPGKNRGAKTEALVADFQREGMFATAVHVETEDFAGGLRSCLSVNKGNLFKPNTIFTSLENRTDSEIKDMIAMARDFEMGILLLAVHPESRFGKEREVNLWVRDQSPDWSLGLKLANLDYAVLMSYQLSVNWHARIRVFTVVSQEEHLPIAREFLENLMEYARMPRHVEIHVHHGEFWDFVEQAPRADLNIMGLAETTDKKTLTQLMEKMEGSCLFVVDSGNESALA